MFNAVNTDRAAPALLSMREAAARSKLSIGTLRRLEALGHFPQRIHQAGPEFPRVVSYLEAEVDDYIANRIKQRDGGREFMAAKGA